ncbi:MAG: hypothetical protein HY876_05025 [Coriobacteriales bacterium]|nr:hypothetical protein [Coriobacteriales bacterium]
MENRSRLAWIGAGLLLSVLGIALFRPLLLVGVLLLFYGMTQSHWERIRVETLGTPARTVRGHRLLMRLMHEGESLQAAIEGDDSPNRSDALFTAAHDWRKRVRVILEPEHAVAFGSIRWMRDDDLPASVDCDMAAAHASLGHDARPNLGRCLEYLRYVTKSSR